MKPHSIPNPNDQVIENDLTLSAGDTCQRQASLKCLFRLRDLSNFRTGLGRSDGSMRTEYGLRDLQIRRRRLRRLG